MAKSGIERGAIALVTGASAGIGAAIVEALCGRGLRVIATARRAEPLEALAKRLGERCLPFVLDVRDADAGLLDALPERWREIAVLVNNAGHDVGGRRRFDQGSMAEWADIIETNVVGLMRVTHAVVPAMLARGRGHIVNIGSVSGFTPYAGGTLYAASKYAVHGFSECLRRDYAGTGIRVSEVMPGLVRTEFARARLRGDEGAAARFYDQAAATLAPEDIARAVLCVLDQPPGVSFSQLIVEPVPVP